MSERPRFTLNPAVDIDVDDLAHYFAIHSPSVASRFYDAVWATLESLLQFPFKGRVREVPGVDLIETRSWPVEGFPSILVFYRVEKDRVRVLRVMHASRDIETELSKEQ